MQIVSWLQGTDSLFYTRGWLLCQSAAALGCLKPQLLVLLAKRRRAAVDPHQNGARTGCFVLYTITINMVRIFSQCSFPNLFRPCFFLNPLSLVVDTSPAMKTIYVCHNTEVHFNTHTHTHTNKGKSKMTRGNSNQSSAKNWPALFN